MDIVPIFLRPLGQLLWLCVSAVSYDRTGGSTKYGNPLPCDVDADRPLSSDNMRDLVPSNCLHLWGQQLIERDRVESGEI